MLTEAKGERLGEMQHIGSQHFARHLQGHGASSNSEAVFTDDGSKIFDSI